MAQGRGGLEVGCPDERTGVPRMRLGLSDDFTSAPLPSWPAATPPGPRQHHFAAHLASTPPGPQQQHFAAHLASTPPGPRQQRHLAEAHSSGRLETLTGGGKLSQLEDVISGTTLQYRNVFIPHTRLWMSVLTHLVRRCDLRLSMFPVHNTTMHSRRGCHTSRFSRPAPGPPPSLNSPHAPGQTAPPRCQAHDVR